MKGKGAMSEVFRNNIYLEPAQEVPVVCETDVIVVGGGPGGIGAAVSAARNGAKTVLVERCGYLGGMGTGGLVTMLPHMSGGSNQLMPGGLMNDVIKRLDEAGACHHPPMEIIGSNKKEDVEYWRKEGMWFVSDEGRVRMTIFHDANMLKCIYNDIVVDVGVKLYLHAWSTKAIVENNHVVGVVFESKSGRACIRGKVIIDATGDADLLPSAGIESTKKMDFHLRMRNMAQSFHIGNIDVDKLEKWEKEHPNSIDKISRQAFEADCFVAPSTGLVNRARSGSIWVNNFIPGMNRPLVDSSNVEDLTSISIYAYKKMERTLKFYREHMPGFENAKIIYCAPMLGIRGGRRLVGEYTLVEKDMAEGKDFHDTIIAVPHLEHDVSEQFPLRCVPYRCLVPKKVDGLLVAGRSFSSQDRVNEMVNLMPHCMGMGQAAGTAAAMAVKENKEVRAIDTNALRVSLREQGIYLPLHEDEKSGKISPEKKEKEEKLK